MFGLMDSYGIQENECETWEQTSENIQDEVIIERAHRKRRKGKDRIKMLRMSSIIKSNTKY